MLRWLVVLPCVVYNYNYLVGHLSKGPFLNLLWLLLLLLCNVYYCRKNTASRKRLPSMVAKSLRV